VTPTTITAHPDAGERREREHALDEADRDREAAADVDARRTMPVPGRPGHCSCGQELSTAGGCDRCTPELA